MKLLLTLLLKSLTFKLNTRFCHTTCPQSLADGN